MSYEHYFHFYSLKGQECDGKVVLKEVVLASFIHANYRLPCLTSGDQSNHKGFF